VPTDILPDDFEQLFPFIKKPIDNTKEAKIGATRYLNKDRAARLTTQATSVVVSINPDDIPILLQVLFLVSKRLKV